MDIHVNHPVRHYVGFVVAICTCALALAQPVRAETASPFVATLGGVWDGDGNPVIAEVLQSSATGPVMVETGAMPDAYGKSRSAFGSNGFEIVTTGGIDREVDVGSGWSDGFIVTGGTGSGVLSMSSRIQGSVSGHGEMFFALFVSDQPFELGAILSSVSAANGLWQAQLPNADRLLHTGVANRCGLPGASRECGHVPYENFQGPLELTLRADVPFTYGQTLYVASLFGGGVGTFGGSESFLNSANFGITVPVGAALQAQSGTVYAAAVPEPSIALMLGMGLALVAARRWRSSV